MAERVRELATRMRFNASSLGEELGIARSSAALYWSGKRPWPIEVAPDLADLLSTNVDRLLRGEAGVRDRRLSWKSAEREDDDMVELDEVDLRLGAGGSYLDGPVGIRKRRFSRSWLSNFTRVPIERLFWAPVEGNSMEPTIRSGEIVLGARTDENPSYGDGIWAIAVGDVGMIKRLRPLPNGTIEIHSDNPVVPVQVAADGEMHVIGEILYVMRRV